MLFGLICIGIIIFILKIMPKRTEYGNKLLGKILGFKRFLTTAEKPQLEKLVEENPEYFYDILPYTYVLGVSDKWIKQFETISIQAPDWYVGNNFDIITFGAFMNSTMSSANSAMSSSPSSSSGGGGFSGGGSGGGRRKFMVM